MNGEKIISRKDFGKIFLGIGALLVALGIVFKFILDPDVIYDLPIYVGGVGIALLIYGGKQFLDKKNADMDVVFSAKTVKNFLTDNAIIIALLVLVVVIMIIQPRFMQYEVFLDILTQSSTKMIVALGICFTLLIAGTDLSAGRMVGLAAVVSTSMLQNPDYANRFFPNMPQLAVIIPILLAIVACAIFGVLNGFLVAKYDMHPFIATLATQVIVYGVTSLYFDLPPNKSQPIGGIRPDFIALGQTKLFQIGSFPGISILVPIAVVFIILVWFILNKTIFGKNVYAIGGNREAAVVSGVNVFATIMGIFIFASLLYGVGGVLEAARTAGATNNYGNGYELDAIAACVVGGVSLNGGVGKVGGIVSGVLIFTVIQYGLQFIAVSPMWQQVIKGIIIAVAVAIDLAKYRRK
ncbi:galactose/methyl galactoside ABC transporter permease MglC [Clostridium sp.]|jgi:methyl-galactoside transport system permease protein|uniref:galactose/methyl galactoside ABC transporter permease MglC n=1 Tax=Clostridium sp. TaxID=1506 RepID=UPI00283B3958|nr:galactose/methyl galactoside ABC transporter permease MglC [Clostridium sp.]MDR3598581.1 galactose/methyl galactoside ABC transporter permease MglC [Clostridium sp.]